MGKPMGHYITLESEKLKENDADCHEKLIGLLAEQIRSLAKPKREDCILVIGLGNWNITPDALGPKVISKILVTPQRHTSCRNREGCTPCCRRQSGGNGDYGDRNRRNRKGDCG